MSSNPVFIQCKKFKQVYMMEGPHKQKVNLNTSTYFIKRRDNKHFPVRKILFRNRTQLSNNCVMLVQ